MKKDALIFIGGSAHGAPMYALAKKMGLAVIITDMSASCPMFSHADDTIVASATNAEQIIQAVSALQKSYTILLAYSGNDFGTRTATLINSQLFDTPMVEGDPNLYNDKVFMKSLFERARVFTPQQRTCSPQDLCTLRDIAYPVIAKPTTLSGARGIKYLENQLALERYAASYGTKSDTIALEHVAVGTQHDINGYFVNRKFYPGGIADRYFAPYPDCYPVYGHFPSRLSRAAQDACYDAMEKIGHAAHLVTSPIKGDVFFDGHRVVAIEIGLRFHGDIMSSCMMPNTGGGFPFFDYLTTIYPHYRSAYRNAFVKSDPQYIRWRILPFTEGRITGINLKAALAEPGVQTIIVRKKPGDTLSAGPDDNTDMLGYILTRGQTLDACDVSADNAISRMHLDTEPAQFTRIPGIQCDLCGCIRTTHVYTPINGANRLFCCPRCGLFQSETSDNLNNYYADLAPQGEHTLEADASLSGANNYEAQLSDRRISFFETTIDHRKAGIHRVLDVGTGHGTFLRWLIKSSPAPCDATAIEPSQEFHEHLTKFATTHNCFFEEFETNQKYDLINGFHVVEHVRSPSAFFKKVRDLLADDGMFYMEVPNLEVIKSDRIVTEFFVRYHLFHFDIQTVLRYLASCGLSVLAIDTETLTDIRGDIRLIAVKSSHAPQAISTRDVRPATRLDWIEGYKIALQKNARHMSRIAEFFDKHRDKRIVVWGAGRIFSQMEQALYNRHYRFDVVDSAVHGKVINGHRVLPPERIQELLPELIVIASDRFATEISQQANALLCGHTFSLVVFDQMFSDEKK